VGGATVARVTASTLNVRSGPGIKHRDIGNVHNAQRYVILARQGSWYKVYWDGSADWISAKYAIPEQH
jgi:uncharacterized protein YgiM (DUF1202 family)